MGINQPFSLTPKTPKKVGIYSIMKMITKGRSLKMNISLDYWFRPNQYFITIYGFTKTAFSGN